MNSNNNNEEERWNLLFKSVWKNVYLIKLIFNIARIDSAKYKLNQCVIFHDINRLREYKDRNFITKIIYKSRKPLSYGDLPINGVLREVEFTKLNLSNTPGEFIPEGVEILTYSPFYGIYSNKTNLKLKTTPFSTLPTTLNTINNAIILLPESTETTTGEVNIIPQNITSIKIITSPRISKDDKNKVKPWLKIPNSIRSLDFKNFNIKNKFNDGLKLKKGDLPEGITKLLIKNYIWKNEFELIPKTVKELEISACVGYNNLIMDLNLTELESLKIHFGPHGCTTPKSNLTKLLKLKKLTIKLGRRTTIHNDSLPLSLEELNLHRINGLGSFGNKFIPNNVSKFSISQKLFIDKSRLFEIPSNVKSIIKITQHLNQLKLITN